MLILYPKTPAAGLDGSRRHRSQHASAFDTTVIDIAE